MAQAQKFLAQEGLTQLINLIKTKFTAVEAKVTEAKELAEAADTLSKQNKQRLDDLQLPTPIDNIDEIWNGVFGG